MQPSPANGSQSIIVVPQIATLEELACAYEFAKILTRAGEQNVVYLGHKNFPLRLQKFLGTNGVNFLLPNKLLNEFILKVGIAKGNKVKGVRWEQTNEELRIHVEMEDESPLEPLSEISVKGKRKFKKVYFVGCRNMSQVEESAFLTQNVDIRDAKRVFFSYIGGKSIWEQVVDYARNEMNLRDTKSENECIDKSRWVSNYQNASLKPESSIAELSTLYEFWQTGKAETEDLIDFLAQLRLFYNLNPFMMFENPKELEKVYRCRDSRGNELKVFDSRLLKDLEGEIRGNGNRIHRIFPEFTIVFDYKEDIEQKEGTQPYRSKGFTLQSSSKNLPDKTTKPEATHLKRDFRNKQLRKHVQQGPKEQPTQQKSFRREKLLDKKPVLPAKPPTEQPYIPLQPATEVKDEQN